MTRWLQRAGGAKRHRTGPAAAAAPAVVRPARPRPARWVHGEARSRRASAWWRAYTTSERCASPGPVARTPCPGSAPPPGDTVAGVEVGDRARARSTRGRPPSPDRGARRGRTRSGPPFVLHARRERTPERSHDGPGGARPLACAHGRAKASVTGLATSWAATARALYYSAVWGPRAAEHCNAV